MLVALEVTPSANRYNEIIDQTQLSPLGSTLTFHRAVCRKRRAMALLERQLDDRNYEGLTKPTKRKDDVSITDATVETDPNDDMIHGNDNNTSNERVEHGIQSTFGDRNGLHIINYSDDDESDRIILATRKPIYKSYKDACSNNIITHGSNNITHAGSNNITHTGSSITRGNNPQVSSK